MLRTHIRAKASSPPDWEECLVSFEDHLLSRGRSQTTVTQYSSNLNVFARFYREELKKLGPKVSRLQETDLHAFVDYLRSTRYLALSSINVAVAALRAFSIFLVEQRWHRRNIARDLKTFRILSSSDPPRLSPEETRRLVTSIDLNARNGYRDLAIVQLLLQCGLRVGEIPRLSLDDVIIRRSSTRIRICDQKSRSQRVIPLNATAREALQRYLETRGTAPGHDPLFLSERKKRISTKNVQHIVKKYLCAAGREDLSAHDLRHYFAHSFYTRSGKLSAVQQVLGHRNISTTARYVRATEEEIAQDLEKLPSNVYHNEQNEE